MADLQIKCVSAGTTSQFDKKFLGQGRQCTAMAYIASALSTIKKRSVLSTADIIFLLKEGDVLYTKLEHLIPANVSSRYLTFDELPSEIRIGQYIVTMKNVKNCWLAQGTYPYCENDVNPKITELVNNLNESVFTSDHNDNTDSVLFTGKGYSYAFWRYESVYYLFNSHAVDKKNKNDSNGVARLFKFESLESLAKVILTYNNNFEGNPYFVMNRVRVLNYVLEQDLQSTSINLNAATAPTQISLNSDLSENNTLTAPTKISLSSDISERNAQLIVNNVMMSSTSSTQNNQCINRFTQNSDSIKNNSISPSTAAISLPTTINISQCSDRTTQYSESILNNYNSPLTLAPTADSQNSNRVDSQSILTNYNAQSALGRFTQNSNSIQNNSNSPSTAAIALPTPIIVDQCSDRTTQISESILNNFNSPSTLARITNSQSSNRVDSQSILTNYITQPTLAASTRIIASQCSNRSYQTSQSILNNFNSQSDQVTIIPPSDRSGIEPNNTDINITNNSLIQSDKKLTTLKPVVVIEKISDFKQSVLKQMTSTKTIGRPKKKKRGRKTTKDNAHLDAVKKYNLTKPQNHRNAARKYTNKNPEVHRDAVKKYTDKNPEAHRDAVKKYTDKNPEAHRDAVKKYTDKKPEVHRDSVKKYTNEKPEIHRIAVDKYQKNNPEMHQAAVKKYTDSHPEVNLTAVQRYAKKHPEINQQSSIQYNKNSRNIDTPLRKSRNLIGEKRGAELDSVTQFSLKKPRLDAPDVHKCPHCGARLFDEEKSRTQWCCGSGANNVQNFMPLTEDFYTHPSFERRPRAYNNMFAFSALGTSHGFHQPEGIAFIKIQGRVYHRVFDLSYEQSMNNISLYINDGSERENLAAERNLDVQIIRSITHFLHNVNPYIECFKRLSLEPSSQAFIQFEKTSRATHRNILGDQPVGREVSAIISTDREQYAPRSIAIWKIGQSKPHTVDIMHPLYESFQFPLLYPEGNPGWYPDKTDNKGKKLTQAKYVRCLLLSIGRFSEFGRLSEEWLVDMYSRISEERLRYLLYAQRRHSAIGSELRTAPLQELLNDETIIAEGVVPGRIYLPNSYTGSPRYMGKKLLDSLGIVNRKGPPSYFITFTCNPNWPEIKQSTRPGQPPNPTICARAFNLRLASLLRDIRSGHWFGNIDYMMHVIEFQKRGLPHAHICFRVEGGGPVENLDIDKVCRADIPNESEADGKLRKAVLDHMVHGPCGRERDNLPCYDKEQQKCTKRFPKRETDTTFCDERGFIHLRRNRNNEAVIKYRGREIVINDMWIVPYNAALLLKYDAHINVEISSQRSVVKYLFKYMSKGPDHARVAIVPEENNEIEEYVTKRYIGSSDAAWRVLEFDITSREPNVIQLSVHLNNQQQIFFRPNNIDEAVSRGSSDLITYFQRPQGEIFDNLKYVDFYENYIVHTKRPTTKNVQIYETGNAKYVTPRQRGEIVARLFHVAPNRGEQFYLRILLNAFPCRSYEDLLRLGGPNCNTFQDAAKAVGLADDMREYENCLQEASSFFTGYRLRNFFVMLANIGAPVASLWETFKNQLSEDILHRMPNEHEQAYNQCLMQIGRLLRKHGSSLAQQGLPEVQDNTTELGRERIEYNSDTQKSFVDKWLPQLSSEQRTIFDYVDRLCTDEQFQQTNQSAIFIDGPAGTGKTLLLNVITAHVRGNLKGVVLCTASSAIAAQIHDGGVTAHSMFKYPLNLEDDCGYWNITNKTQRAELIFHANLIIYDEAPMAHKYLIHLLDRSLRDLMNSNRIFGGKIIIFAGDFRQIPPVVPDAKSNFDILNSSVKTSPVWQNLKTFSLLTSQRCRDDPEYADFLLKLGSNKLNQTLFRSGDRTERLISLESIEIVSNVDELINFVFGLVLDEPDVCTHRAILCLRNDAVREINSTILERVPGEILHFYSIDKVVNDDADQFALGPDTLNRLQPPGVPEYHLKLKEGCVCMIIRNLSFADGLVNGTKVIVVSTTPRLITVRKPGGDDNYLIPRILFKAHIYKNSPFEMCRRQFPLQVCYAMTVHKSQGQTIGRVGLDLRSDVFSHGQLYVALGRVREKRNIKILLHEDRVINGHPYANNKVIPELL